MILAVASGKGGTGKTTFAVNLSLVMDGPVRLLDCDVEEPNAHLFLPGPILKEEKVCVPIPQVDESRCDGCGECSKFCAYHAIVCLVSKPLIFPELCHGCGGCMRVCPQKAVSETQKEIGGIEYRKYAHIDIATGRLNIGSAMAPPVIHAVKKNVKANGVVIIDAPPGTSCPVVASALGADFVLMVTEPTPFGLHDLTLAVDMIREIGVPFGVAVNRAGSGDDRVNRYCRDENIPILLEVPDDRRIAEAYSIGRPIVEALPEYRPLFEKLRDRLFP